MLKDNIKHFYMLEFGVIRFYDEIRSFINSRET